MKIDETGTIESGRIARTFVILFPLLVAATRLLPDTSVIDATTLLGSATGTLLAHVLAALSIIRTILGARRTSDLGDWFLRRLLGERIAECFRDAPAVGDLIANACHALRARKGGLQRD